MQITINDRTARAVQSWAEWGQVPLDEMVNRICCQWLATQECTLGDMEAGHEWLDWLDSEGADTPTNAD